MSGGSDDTTSFRRRSAGGGDNEGTGSRSLCTQGITTTSPNGKIRSNYGVMADPKMSVDPLRASANNEPSEAWLQRSMGDYDAPKAARVDETNGMLVSTTASHGKKHSNYRLMGDPKMSVDPLRAAANNEPSLAWLQQHLITDCDAAKAARVDETADKAHSMLVTVFVQKMFPKFTHKSSY